jgi:hypothetical protein
VIQNLLGASLGPIVIGAISDRPIFRLPFQFFVVPVLASVLFLVGSLFYKKDIQKVEKVDLEAAE